MKKYIFTVAFFCLVLSFFYTENIFAQGFNSVSCADGINVTAVGNAGKLYRSTNGGVTWATYPNSSVNMNCVVSFNTDVWIAANHGTVYKTSNVNSPVITYTVGSTTNLNSISVISANTLIVCGDAGEVYKSVNGGLTWTSSNSGIANIKLNSISFTDANNGIIAGNNGSIYLTSNGGASWTLQSSLTTKNLLKVKYFADGYAAVGEYGALIVKNASGTSAVATRIKTDIRGVTGEDINNVHVCGGGGFIRNNKNGSGNFYNFEQNPMTANLVDIFLNGSNGWAVSSLNSVIIYTTDAGATWKMSQGSTVSRSWVSKLSAGSGIGNNLCEHPFNRDAMFVVYGSTVYRSGNRAETWTNINSIPGGGSAHSFYVSPLDTNIWMVAITGSPDKVKRTTNYGASWTDVVSANFSNYGQPLEMDQNNPSNYYFAPDNGGFYRSTDNGASFTEISGNYPFRSPCDIIVTWDSSDVIFVGDGVTGSGQAKIFKSVNNGVNWTEVYTVTSSETPALCNSVFNKSMCYSTEWGGAGFYKTTDYGNNWALAGPTGGNGWGTDLCREDPTVVLKGSYGSPTYLTTNSGVSFVSNSIGGGSGAGIIVPERGYLVAMQSNGLLKMQSTYNDSIINPSTVTGSLNESFTSGFVPSGWSLESVNPGTNYWIYSSQGGYDVGTGSAEYNFWNSQAGRNQSMVTKTFTASVANDSLAFDYAYAPYTNASNVDSLIIEISSDGGNNYTRFKKLYGKLNYNNPDSTLNTRAAMGSEYNDPTSSEWKSKRYLLPVGTNKIKFRARSGFGNNLYLDNIKVTANASSSATNVDLKLAPQGLFNGISLNLRDTISVYLRNAVSPFNKIDSVRTVIDQKTLTASCQFNNAPSGTYYFQVIHRNALETWSRYGGEQIINGAPFVYDFTSAPGQGYGKNQVFKNPIWCLYSGDVNQDGSIESLDMSIIDNAAFNFVTGYVASDLNGDETVDAADLAIVDFNSFNFISKITPENAPTLFIIDDIKARQMNSSIEKMNLNRSKALSKEITK